MWEAVHLHLGISSNIQGEAGVDFLFQYRMVGYFCYCLSKVNIFLSLLNHLSLFFTQIATDFSLCIWHLTNCHYFMPTICRATLWQTWWLMSAVCLVWFSVYLFIYKKMLTHLFLLASLMEKRGWIWKYCQHNSRKRFFFTVAYCLCQSPFATSVLSCLLWTHSHSAQPPLSLLFGSHFLFWAGGEQLPWWTCCHPEQTKVFTHCGAFNDKHPVVFTLSSVTECNEMMILQVKGVYVKQMQSYPAASGSVLVKLWKEKNIFVHS